MVSSSRSLLFKMPALLLVATLAFSLPVTVQTVGAQESEQPERKTRKTPAMREKIYKQLSEAQVAAEADNYQGASAILNKLAGDDSLNSYEKAQMYNFFAFIYYSQDRYGDAVRAYENVLAQPDLPEGLENGTIYSLAQLYFQSENYPKSIEYMERWFQVANNPGPDPYVIVAQAYYQLKEYRKALPNIENAMRIARQQGKTVKENWLLLQRLFYYELNDFTKSEQVLKELIRLYPKKVYYTQLSATYHELGDDKKQLAALELAYLQGMLTEGRELLNLSQLYLANGVPYKGATILQQAVDNNVVEIKESNLRLLSQSWFMAGEYEKAIPPLQRAAQISNDGDLYIRLAQSYL
ncbi:MAG: tetratricopeptide repeat protein, partial [Pseudomonadales bacterium]|nr:tetratricopeptide repeat protein [Pseudomonadales bacterium]